MPRRWRACILRPDSRWSSASTTKNGRGSCCDGGSRPTMPRIWVPANELTSAPETAAPPASVTLTGEAHHYLTRVVRVAVGARIDLFDGLGNEAEATIDRIGPRDLAARVVGRRTVARATTPPVTLLQGLPRAERMDLVVQKAAELGARRVVPVRAARSASGQSARSERWERIALEAARQSGRA